MKPSTLLKAGAALFLAVCVALFAPGCQDDGASLTGASSVSSSPETAGFATSAVSASHSGPEDDPSDDPSEDDSSDDTSEDETSDDVSEDQASDDDDAEARGLFFGIEACPAVDGCVVALRIKDTMVVLTSDTEIVNQANGDQIVPLEGLVTLVGGHIGLPMKAEGTSQGGVLVASKLRIQDEIRATGMAVAAAGCDFGLDVRGEVLCFELATGEGAPALGSTVRVEGLVPSDFSLPFLASRVRPSDD